MTQEPSYDDRTVPSSQEARARLDGAALVRCSAAAGGALAGGLLATPIAGLLVVVLFQRIGIPLVESIVSGADVEASGLAGIIATVFLAIAAVVVAATVVIALVAPVFVVLPISAIALALRLARAGLIMPTVGLALATVLGFAAVVLGVTSVADWRPGWMVWFPILGAGGFLGRLFVELWRPEQARVPGQAGSRGRRWMRLGLASLVILVVSVAAAILLVLIGARVTGPS